MIKNFFRAILITLVMGLGLPVSYAQTPVQGPIKSIQINATYFVGVGAGFYPSIQSAITAACTNPAGSKVVIPTTSSPSDTIAGVTTGCVGVQVTDERGIAPYAIYNWNGSSLVLATGTANASKAAAWVQSTSFVLGSAGPGTSVTTMGSNTTTGDIILVAAYCNGTTGSGFGTVSSVSDSQGNTYTQVLTGGSWASYQGIWIATNIRGGPDTITVHGAGLTPQAGSRASEYKNVSSVLPVDASTVTGANGSGTISITTTRANDLIVAPAFNATSQTITGYTQRASGSQLPISDATAGTVGLNNLVITATSGAGGSGFTYDLLVALTNGVPPPTPTAPASGTPASIGVYVPGTQQSANQLYLAIPATFPMLVNCTNSLAGATIAATGSTAFTVVDHAGGINGTSTTLCTATWSASGTAAAWTGTGGFVPTGDYITVLAPASADATLANITFGISITK